MRGSRRALDFVVAARPTDPHRGLSRSAVAGEAACRNLRGPATSGGAAPLVEQLGERQRGGVSKPPQADDAGWGRGVRCGVSTSSSLLDQRRRKLLEKVLLEPVDRGFSGV
jgi:hypothetical protein